MIAEETGIPRPARRRARAFGLGAALVVLRTATAAAFPLLDPSTQGVVPSGTELPTPDATDLQHQLQLANGLAAPFDGGWTFTPRIDLQEMFTDNVLQAHDPRQWDLVTFIAPGLDVAANTPRLQMNFDIQPTLSIYANESSLNSLTQQFTGTGTLTVVDDLAYIDFRALSGVTGLNGGIGGIGTLGATGTTTSAATIPSLAGNAIGLNKDNEVQTTSFAISPYLLHRFSDIGTGKLGYSLNVSRSSVLTGFASSPLPTGGANGQTLLTNEEMGHFDTENNLGRINDTIDIDLQQASTTTDAGFPNGFGTFENPANNVSDTNRTVFTDQVNYALNRAVTVFVSGGHENISYTGAAFQTIDDFTWSFGTTLTPNPDSSLTVSYGHSNGFNSFNANGYYQLTSRTLLTVAYSSQLGTQLQNLQNEFNGSTINANGALVNVLSNGTALGNINALGIDGGIFRTNTFSLGGQTNLARDIFSVDFLLTKQTQVGTVTTDANTTDATVVTGQWTHQIHPDLTLTSAVAYSLQNVSGVQTGLNAGNNWSIAASAALQYQISDTLSGSLRYSFFDRQSPVTSLSVYQNLFIVGITKRF